tara:strand:+ start:2733 stop:3002 length:270 start_codon:yes stop_codon:yes gene_type:complete
MGPDSNLHLKAYDIGIMFGCQAAKSAFHYYTEKIESAEVEDDLLETMSIFWSHDELVLRAMFDAYPLPSIREGWTEGFFNTIFPLRHMV